MFLHHQPIVRTSSRHYRFTQDLFIERFGSDAVLLVADRDLLLTINAAAADLFEATSLEFHQRNFDVHDVAAWLSNHYQLPPEDCRVKSRELLAFGLKHHIVDRVVTEQLTAATEESS